MTSLFCYNASSMRTLFEQGQPKNLSLRNALAGGIILIAIGFALGFTAGAGAEGKGGPLGNLVPPPGVDFSPVWKAWSVTSCLPSWRLSGAARRKQPASRAAAACSK